uniref:Secreted protein n=1 Tax=Anguilla anguilla TaxID=7936 RepID=A0A0E9X1U4_ANGAN
MSDSQSSFAVVLMFLVPLSHAKSCTYFAEIIMMVDWCWCCFIVNVLQIVIPQMKELGHQLIGGIPEKRLPALFTVKLFKIV